MLHSGSYSIELPNAVCKFIVKSDGEFVVYGCKDGEKVTVLGPKSKTHRSAVFFADVSLDEVLVAGEGDTLFSVDMKEIPPPHEIIDPTPLEIPLNMQRPPSLQEEMKRFIRSEISNRAMLQERGSFEDEDDFDIADPDELDLSSKYEFEDLVPEPMQDFSEEPPPAQPSEGMEAEAKDTESEQPQAPIVADKTA